MCDLPGLARRASAGLGTVILGAAGWALASGPSPPAQRAQGAALYREHCARCHGDQGRGDGPLADQFAFRPPDLTRMARRAGGRFPAELAKRVIDGRKPVKDHGGPEMPAWGDALKAASEGYDEKKAEDKVTLLVQFLESIQERAHR